MNIPSTCRRSLSLTATRISKIVFAGTEQQQYIHRFFCSSQNDLTSSKEKEQQQRNEEPPHISTNETISKIDPRLSEWIPPDRPLAGDQGFSHLYKQQSNNDKQNLTEEDELEQLEEELKRLEEADVVTNDAENTATTAATPPTTQQRKAQPQTMDWLQTRREKLGTAVVDGMTLSYDRPGQTMKVVHHTLLTAEEIMDYLESLGGMNPNLVKDQIRNANGDSRLGGAFEGMIFVSANSCAHVRMLAQSLVDQMKLRKLQDVGVQGARHGPEGSDDLDETWLVIDCHNYVVHIQDEPTRRMLNLEDWWSKPSPLEGVNVQNEDAIDDFVANNPVPPEYRRSGLSNWNATINQLQNKRYTAPHRAVVNDRPRFRRKKKGGGKRR